MDNKAKNSQVTSEKDNKENENLNDLTAKKIEDIMITSSPINNWKTFLLEFKPKLHLYEEFNPILKPEYSLPAIGISFALLAYYKRKYYLINNFSIALFSLYTNYLCSYYLLVNAVEFYKYSNSKLTSLYSLDQPNKLN
jgi:hypothetical protein